MTNLYGSKKNGMFVFEENCAKALNDLYKYIEIDVLHQVEKKEIVLIKELYEKLFQAIEKSRETLITLLKSKDPNKKIQSFENVVTTLFNYIKSHLISILDKTKKIYQYNFDIGHISKDFLTCYNNSQSKWPILFYNNEI